MTSNPTGHTVEFTPGRLRRNLSLSIGASTVGTGWVAVALGVPNTMLLLHLGASGVQIGLIAAVQQVAVLMQFPASLFAERLPHRRAFWAWFCLVHRVLWFAPCVLLMLPGMSNSTKVWTLIAVVGVSALLAQIAAVAWFSWMADLVPKRIGGRFWGLRQSATMVSFIAGCWLAGKTLDRFGGEGGDRADLGFILAFAVAGVLGVVDVLMHWMVDEPPHERTLDDTPVLDRLKKVWANPDFRWLTLSMGLWMFSLGLAGSFGVVYLRQDFHASYTDLAWLAMAGPVGALVAGWPLGLMIDRIGARSIGALMMVLGPVVGLICWLGVRPGDVVLPVWGGASVPVFMAVLMPTNLVCGVLYSAVGLCQLHLVNTLTGRQGRMLVLGLYWSVSGLMAAAGPIVGGWVMDWLLAHPLKWELHPGMALSYFHVLLIVQTALASLLASSLLCRVHERGTGFPAASFLAFLRIGNPLRLLGMLYNVFPFSRDSEPDSDNDEPHSPAPLPD
jgi:MFS family permease